MSGGPCAGLPTPQPLPLLTAPPQLKQLISCRPEFNFTPSSVAVESLVRHAGLMGLIPLVPDSLEDAPHARPKLAALGHGHGHGPPALPLPLEPAPSPTRPAHLSALDHSASSSPRSRSPRFPNSPGPACALHPAPGQRVTAKKEGSPRALLPGAGRRMMTSHGRSPAEELAELLDSPALSAHAPAQKHLLGTIPHDKKPPHYFRSSFGWAMVWCAVCRASLE